MTEQEYIGIGNLTKIRAAKSLIRDIDFSDDDDGAVQQQAREQTAILSQLIKWEDSASSGLKITPDPDI